MGTGWVCSSCHSINDARHGRCYSCRAHRELLPIDQAALATEPQRPGWSAAAAEAQPQVAVRYTGVVLRTAALFVDLALISTYWAVLLLGLAGRGSIGPIVAALLVAGPILYFLVAWGRFGTTIGMRLLSLRIVRSRDGTQIGYRTALLRLVAFVLSIVAYVTVLGGLLVLPMVIDKRRRAVHDHVAGTVVVRPATGRL